MPRRRMQLLAVPLLVLPLLVGGFMLQQGPGQDGAGARLFAEVFARIAGNAVDSLSSDQVYEKAARGLVANLNDPYAELYSPEELASFTRNQIGNAYAGLGMQIEDQNGIIVVTRVFPHTPAEQGGVQVGDRILEVDGASTKGWKVGDVSGKLIGQAGSRVAVTFRRPGAEEPIQTEFSRAVIHVPAVPFALLLDNRIGYIPLQRFNQSASEEVAAALADLQRSGLASLVLDLRGNPGGSLDESIRLSDFFLRPGQEIATVRHRGQAPIHYRAEHRPVISVPVVVLLDGGSASASEIVAGSLQDHDRALVVGTTSFGKGLVQTMFPLKEGWALRVTTGQWFTPSGRSIQRDHKVAGGQIDGEPAEQLPDSLETDSVLRHRPVFRSDAGRAVYGGGGITPDRIVAVDTASTVEQDFFKSLAPYRRQMYLALYDMALEKKRSLRPDFTVLPAWRGEFYQRLRQAEVPVDRAAFEQVPELIDRLIEYRFAVVAFGEASAFQRTMPHDRQLREALALLRPGTTQLELLGLAAAGN